MTKVRRLPFFLQLFVEAGTFFDFFFGVCHAHQFTPADEFQGVTGAADFAIDLETATEGRTVKAAEKSRVPPRIGRSVYHVVRKQCHCGDGRRRQRACGSQGVAVLMELDDCCIMLF